MGCQWVTRVRIDVGFIECSIISWPPLSQETCSPDLIVQTPTSCPDQRYCPPHIEKGASTYPGPKDLTWPILGQQTGASASCSISSTSQNRLEDWCCLTFLTLPSPPNWWISKYQSHRYSWLVQATWYFEKVCGFVGCFITAWDLFMGRGSSSFSWYQNKSFPLISSPRLSSLYSQSGENSSKGSYYNFAILKGQGWAHISSVSKGISPAGHQAPLETESSVLKICILSSLREGAGSEKPVVQGLHHEESRKQALKQDISVIFQSRCYSQEGQAQRWGMGTRGAARSWLWPVWWGKGLGTVSLLSPHLPRLLLLLAPEKAEGHNSFCWLSPHSIQGTWGLLTLSSTLVAAGGAKATLPSRIIRCN